MTRGGLSALRLHAIFVAWLALAPSPDVFGQAANPGNAVTSSAIPVGFTFEGLASWYGVEFQGRPTSSGEIFDKEDFTAAHRSLPFGSLVRVTSLDTGASVVVRVNDRGPFVASRVIDLSEGAARLIGMLPTGTAHVSCKVIPPEEAAAFGSPSARTGPIPQAAQIPPATGSSLAGTGIAQAGAAGSPGTLPAGAVSCRIQVAAYRDEKNALATMERLRLSGLSPTLEKAGALRRVVFPFVPAGEAEALASRLRSLGYRDILISWSRNPGK